MATSVRAYAPVPARPGDAEEGLPAWLWADAEAAPSGWDDAVETDGEAVDRPRENVLSRSAKPDPVAASTLVAASTPMVVTLAPPLRRSRGWLPRLALGGALVAGGALLVGGLALAGATAGGATAEEIRPRALGDAAPLAASPSAVPPSSTTAPSSAPPAAEVPLDASAPSVPRTRGPVAPIVGSPSPSPSSSVAPAESADPSPSPSTAPSTDPSGQPDPAPGDEPETDPEDDGDFPIDLPTIEPLDDLFP